MDKDSAFEKLEHGEVYATIVLPQDFSNSIAKIFIDSNNRDFARAQYFVNERENGAAVKITDTGASTIEKQINEKFVGKVTEVVAGKVVELSGALVVDVANSGNTMTDRINRVAANVSGLNNVIKKGQGTISQAQETISSAKSVLTDVKNESDNLQNIVNNAKQKAQDLKDSLLQYIIEAELPYSTIAVIINMIDDLSSSLSDLSSSLFIVSHSCDEIISQLYEASYLLDGTNSIAADFSAKMSKVHDLLLEVSTTIQANLTNAPDVVKALTNANTQTVGAFMSQPVKLETEVLNPIANNGTGISPFFTNLAL